MNEKPDPLSVPGQVPPPPAVERFRNWGIIAWSVIGVLILGGVVLWGITRVTEIFPPLVVALVTVFLLNPVVTRLEGLGVRRLFGSCMTYLLLVAVVAVILALLIPALINQGQDFARDFPRTVERISDFAVSVVREIELRIGTGFELGEWIGGRADLAPRIVGVVGGFLQGAVQTMALFVIGLVAGFYLLIDLPRLRSAALGIVPPERRDEAREVASGVSTAIGGFFRGSLLLALIVGILSSVGFRIIGLPYWLVVGFIAGGFNLLPLVGPFIGAIPALIIAAALMPPITIVWVIVVILVVQSAVNYFVAPHIMGLTVRMHPVTVMLSLIAGATLAGFWGLLLAVPVFASIKVIVAHFWRTRIPWGEEVFRETRRMESIPREQVLPGIEVPDEYREGRGAEATGTGGPQQPTPSE